MLQDQLIELSQEMEEALSKFKYIEEKDGLDFYQNDFSEVVHNSFWEEVELKLNDVWVTQQFLEQSGSTITTGKYKFKHIFADKKQQYDMEGRFEVTHNNGELHVYIVPQKILRKAISEYSDYFYGTTYIKKPPKYFVDFWEKMKPELQCHIVELLTRIEEEGSVTHQNFQEKLEKVSWQKLQTSIHHIQNAIEILQR